MEIVIECFQLEIVIECNSSAIRVLEELQKKIASKSGTSIDIDKLASDETSGFSETLFRRALHRLL